MSQSQTRTAANAADGVTVPQPALSRCKDAGPASKSIDIGPLQDANRHSHRDPRRFVESNTPEHFDISEGPETRAASISYPLKNRFRLATSCLLNFTNGMNDAAPGVLIPHMEK